MQVFVATVRCGACGAPPTNAVFVRYFERPTHWLRPGAECLECNSHWGHLRGGKDLVQRMCHHFIRDTMTHMTCGAPWKLLREEARAEDVSQGGLGNCWFAGALSVVAGRCPKLINDLLLTKEHCEYGVYALRLFHAGNWHDIIVDDRLPTSRRQEGFMDGVPEVRGTRVTFAAGGYSCYLHGARRQLWVPLLEKAAAKLFGSYSSLIGGTFGEALSIFTGCPVKQLRIALSEQEQARRLQLQQAQAAASAQVAQGGGISADDVAAITAAAAADAEGDGLEDDDTLWSKIMAASKRGHIMGMGCTAAGSQRRRQDILQMGLTPEHAYGILDLREVKVGGGVERLMKIRNPLGERVKKTWTGDWGKDSGKWTPELKLELGVVNQSGVEMEDSMSIFWISFGDVKRYFSAVEICRLRPTWPEPRRCSLALPGGTGCGQAAHLTVASTMEVDVAFWQEKQNVHEGSYSSAASSNVDIGLAVFRKSAATAGDGCTDAEARGSFSFVEYAQRVVEDCISQEFVLEGGYTYRFLPVSFGAMQPDAARCGVFTVYAAREAAVQVVESSWREVAEAVIECGKMCGQRTPISGAVDGVSAWSLLEHGGTSFIVENASELTHSVRVDASQSLGCTSSRSSLNIVCAVPPKSRQVLLALAFAPGAARSRCLVEATQLPPDAASFALVGDGLHATLSAGLPA